eukprot:gene11665-13780_t
MWAAVLCIFTLFVYASFMGMLAAWLLLGAILNPDQFLPYGVAVVTVCSVAAQRYVSLKTMYTDMIEKMCEATTRMINEDLLKPVQEMLIPEEALDELQQAAVTRLGAMPGLGGMDASALLKSIANSDLESISAQLVAQPLMSSLGLSPQALKAVLKGDLNEVELHVSKALKVHSRKGRAVIRAILATCPPWNAVSPPPELLLAVEELAQEAGIPARLAVSVASFLFASKYKESQTTWNAAMEDFLEQILAMEVPRTDANGKRAKVLREMVGPDVLMCAIHLTLGDLRALVLLLERYWNTPASRALLNIVRWYSYSSGSDSGMEPSALASMRRDLATFSELSSDRVMRPVEPEIDIFVWADVPYFASFDEVSLEKALNMRPIVKCLLMLLPFYYGIGSLALVCHITSLRAWDPAAFVTHTRLRRFFTGSFN